MGVCTRCSNDRLGKAGELKLDAELTGGTGSSMYSVLCFLFGYKAGGLYVAAV